MQRVAIVTVNDPSALDVAGGTLFKPTAKSGITDNGFTRVSNSANGVTDLIMSNTLESSNVDMAAEFVNLIQTQRAYSANSKTITTADEMLQDVLQLKR